MRGNAQKIANETKRKTEGQKDHDNKRDGGR